MSKVHPSMSASHRNITACSYGWRLGGSTSDTGAIVAPADGSCGGTKICGARS
ncbi:uncharacterized protein HMPREF1541_06419 [Cyphellophora europaea CBS 101466]|uniref:Uncharacterized protein n=1 Tax=Cyphellophora europaea (strain CBS 101466) TaxID=1220924 RepID=W2RRQ9_CYPE1|nr:uncharacterized protein HMPREF1541_06419 [Cyphellophora europaea CBS 101466]ETN38384.1 hypothetical protein HMPREF1541_06419 [Cyphellophora europaea CBS 101466]